MPTYDYRCGNDHVFEVFHAITDDSPRACPECGAPAKRVPGGGSGGQPNVGHPRHLQSGGECPQICAPRRTAGHRD